MQLFTLMDMHTYPTYLLDHLCAAGTYCPVAGNGGSNGATMRYDKEVPMIGKNSLGFCEL